MKVSEITKAIEGTVLCHNGKPDQEFLQAFASDLMSDVLTVKTDNLLLITGLVNVQAIRTAEMSDIYCIIFARDKSISSEILNLAKESGITLIRTSFSMFRTSGILYRSGINPVY